MSRHAPNGNAFSTDDPPELSTALLRWVQSFDFASSIETYKDLQDGKVIWQILDTVEPAYFGGDLPEGDAVSADNWIPRWQNLKHIDKLVTTYIRDSCEKLPELSKRMTPDLKAIAIDASQEDSIQFLKIILLATLYSPLSNKKMVQVMHELPGQYTVAIANCIGHMEALDRRMAEEARADIGSDSGGMLSPERSNTPAIASQREGLHRDPELEREERLIEAYTAIKDREAKLSTLSAELQDKRQHNSELLDELTELRYRLEQGGFSGANNEVLEQLHQKSAQDRDYIAELESELNGYKESADDLERQLVRLKGDAESKQKLRDELQMLKVERDDLLQKTKANENLKKKIQTLQESDKSNGALRQDLEVLQEEVRILRPLRERCNALQKANEENMKTIANGEQEIFDMKTYRKRLDHELKVISTRYDNARNRQQQDSETINQLEERIRDLEAGGKGAEDMGTLDDELETGDKAQSELRAKLKELEIENAQLRANPAAVPGEDTVAKTAHELLQERHNQLERKYLEVYSENLGLDAALKDSDEAVQESRPFVELRDRLRLESGKLAEAEKRLFETEGALADTRIRLEIVDAKLSSVDKDQAGALEEIHQSMANNNEVLEKERDRLAIHGKALDIDLEETRGLLRHALLDKRAMLREDEELRASNELKLIQHELSSFKRDNLPSEESLALSLTQRIEDARKRVTELEVSSSQDREDLDAQVQGLKKKLKNAEDEAAKGAKTPLQDNLQRELALMSSAWYDVTSRLQSDAVIVQRRSEQPRSFLNKQRRLLSTPTTPVSIV